MSSSRSRRVAASFTEPELAALAEIAANERVPVASVVAQLTRAHLLTGRARLPVTLDGEAGDHQAPISFQSPPWLPPLHDQAEWGRSRAAAVQGLLDRYPAELSALDNAWSRDALAREQLWALTVWRDLLDCGTYDDPRMELAFAHALIDFGSFLRERPRMLARQHR